MADSVVMVTWRLWSVLSLNTGSNGNNKNVISQINNYSPWLASLFQYALEYISSHVSCSKIYVVMLVGLVPLVMLGPRRLQLPQQLFDGLGFDPRHLRFAGASLPALSICR